VGALGGCGRNLTDIAPQRAAAQRFPAEADKAAITAVGGLLRWKSMKTKNILIR
jgi:hypothetical protein